MRIVVCIKQVPETTNVTMDPETGTVVRSGLKSIVNPLDLFAIEAALLLREAHGGEVFVVCMGPPAADAAVREAIAMGCDRGVLVTDRKFAGSDTWVTSRVLANAIERNGPFDLLLFGERATDGDTGQVGPGVASFLDLPVVTYVSDITVRDDVVEMRRLVETGYERYRCTMPVVVTVVKEIAYPRLPTLSGKKRARLAEVPVLTNAEFGLDETTIGLKGSPTRVEKIHKPRISREGERIVVRDESDALAAVDRIVAYLRENHLLTPGGTS